MAALAATAPGAVAKRVGDAASNWAAADVSGALERADEAAWLAAARAGDLRDACLCAACLAPFEP